MRLFFLILLLLPTQRLNAEEQVPFIQFEKGFHRVIVKLGWGNQSPQEVKNLTVAIWRGSGRNLERAGYVACIGVMESHWKLPAPDDYHNYRGYCGGHNKTLLAEIKRMKLGGSDKMWLSYWKMHPSSATYYSATRFWYLLRTYHDVDVVLKSWVAGESWKTDPKERLRAEGYAKNVRALHRRYFENQN